MSQKVFIMLLKSMFGASHLQYKYYVSILVSGDNGDEWGGGPRFGETG